MRIRNVALAAALAAAAGIALAQGAPQSASQPAPSQPGGAPCAVPPCGPAPGLGHPRHRGPGGKIMMYLDTDGDGQISRAELQAAQQRQLERFEKADANADGKLAREEMRAMREQWRGMMGRDQHPCPGGPGAMPGARPGA